MILYVAEAVEGRINAHLDLKEARDALADVGERLVKALAGSDLDAAATESVARDYHDAWTAYRNFLYRPLEIDEAILAERMTKLARRAKIKADERTVAIARVAKFHSLRASALARHGSLDAYADALLAADDAALSKDLATAMRSYNAARERHLREIYESDRRSETLLGEVDDLGWLLAGGPRGAANDPWSGRADAHARWGRKRSKAALRSAFEDASRNRLQTYDDEAEILAALTARLRAAGNTEAADALDVRRRSTLLQREADARLVKSGGFVNVTRAREASLRDRLEGTLAPSGR